MKQRIGMIILIGDSRVCVDCFKSFFQKWFKEFLFQARQTTMELLPVDCLQMIAVEIAHHDGMPRPVWEVAVDAMNLVLTGNKCFYDLSACVQEILEPGGCRNAVDEFERVRLPADVTMASLQKTLKEACQARGLHVSGAKATLMARLRAAEDDVRPPHGCHLTAKFRRDISTMHMFHPKLIVEIKTCQEWIERATILAKEMRNQGLTGRVMYGKCYDLQKSYICKWRGCAKTVASKIKMINDRKNVLERALANKKCELRGDSRLCKAFIEDGEGCPEDIAETMEEMKFYYNHTRYLDILDKVWDNAREERNYYNYWDRIDPDEMSSQAKSQALKQWAKANDISSPELPKSLQVVVRKIKASDIALVRLATWRCLQPCIPKNIRHKIEDVMLNVAKTIPLEELDNALDDAEMVMTKRVVDVNAAIDNIKEWGGNDALSRYTSEESILNATREGHQQLVKRQSTVDFKSTSRIICEICKMSCDKFEFASHMRAKHSTTHNHTRTIVVL